MGVPRPDTMSPTTLTVLVVSWNTVDLLRICLNAVLGTVGDLTHEIIVIDNGSTDGSLAMIQTHFTTVRTIRNEANLGFARANNTGLQTARGRFILLLNSDTEVRDDALQQMIAFLDAHPDVGVVGASLLNADGTSQFSYDLFPLRPRDMVCQRIVDVLCPRNTYTRQGRMARWTHTGPFEVDWVSGAALMIRREVIDEIGPLDKRFFMYAEEIDWCYRVKKAGWKVYHLPDARVVHTKQGSSAGAPALRTHLARQRDHSLELFYRKHYGWPAAIGVWLIHARHRSISRGDSGR